MSRVVAVSVTNLFDSYVEKFHRVPSSEELYHMARWAWRANWETISSCRYLFACVQGVVKEVYEVDEWFLVKAARERPELRPPAEEGSDRYLDIERDVRDGRRKACVGHVADCAANYRGKEAPRLCGPIGYTVIDD